MTVQQQQMAVLNQFDESGANLDSSMSDFIDAVADRSGVPDARKALRSAVALHAAKSTRLTGIVGPKTVDEYQLGLGKLRKMVDETGSVDSGVVAAQMHADILLNKKRISEAAWARIGEKGKPALSFQ